MHRHAAGTDPGTVSATGGESSELHARGKSPLEELVDFPLMLGGPLYQLFLRLRVTRPPLDLMRRRILLFPAVTWLPLLVLSILEGTAWTPGLRVPFVYDFEVHARYLIALPVMIAAELIVHQRLSPVVARFVSRGIVPPPALPRFHALVASALRLRNSVVAEVVLVALIYTVGHYVWQRGSTLPSPTWWATAVVPELRLSWAGWWYAYVSIPIHQFILLRWYFRLFIWFRFLGQASRLDLRIVPTHPDRAGGLGFLGNSAYAFAPLLFAQGTLLAGMLANRIFHAGHSLLDYQREIAGIVLALVLFVLAPLLQFSLPLVAAKRAGLRQYGDLASQYVSAFDAKWVQGTAPEGEALVGSADIQSLADLANSFEVVRTMRPIPFWLDTVVSLVLTTALPVAPLVLTVIPLDELLRKLATVLL